MAAGGRLLNILEEFLRWFVGGEGVERTWQSETHVQERKKRNRPRLSFLGNDFVFFAIRRQKLRDAPSQIICKHTKNTCVFRLKRREKLLSAVCLRPAPFPFMSNEMQPRFHLMQRLIKTHKGLISTDLRGAFKLSSTFIRLKKLQSETAC